MPVCLIQNKVMKHCTQMSHPSSLSETCMHQNAPVSIALMTTQTYTPDSFSQPCSRWKHNTPSRLHSRCWYGDPEWETALCGSHRSLSWCRLTWSKQSSVFLRRYVRHRASHVRPYLLPAARLHGNLQWRSHLVSVSRSQYERCRGERERGRET